MLKYIMLSVVLLVASSSVAETAKYEIKVVHGTHQNNTSVSGAETDAGVRLALSEGWEPVNISHAVSSQDPNSYSWVMLFRRETRSGSKVNMPGGGEAIATTGTASLLLK